MHPMTDSLPLLTNTQARHLFLARHGLCEPPTGPCNDQTLAQIIDKIGFVQVDSINTVARAHHMILRSRATQYQPSTLAKLLERDHSLFEHWTHDASIIPAKFFPYWRLKFERDAERLRSRWKNWRRDGFEQKFDEVLRRISDHGPCSSADVGEDEKRSSGGWWDWHPSKTALEYLWRSGQLSVARREGFRKIYDLTENVIPPEYLNARVEEADVIDWACNAALDRLGFATSGELAAFWDMISPAEAKAWCAQAHMAGQITPALIESHDKTHRQVFCRPETLNATPPEPPARLRIMSPFDPALRDRKRAERLFGFNYRIEIFVPEAKRKYGYYVFPVMEGDRLIGRIDMKCFRPAHRMVVRAFWPEPRQRMGTGRLKRLQSEIERLSRFAGAKDLEYAADWQRVPI